MRVKAKSGLWFRVLVWVILIIISTGIIMVPQNERVVGYAVGVPMIFLILWVYIGSYYEFREDYLYCKIGPFYQKIAYEKIKSVRLAENLASSMALSAKQIEIRQQDKGYILGTTFISPVNREEFMLELIKRCKNLDRTI